MLKIRFFYLIAAIAVMIAGITSRKFKAHLPHIPAEYAGDTLWALMLFLWISALFAHKSRTFRASMSLSAAYLVEISQLYHAPWIDSLRQTSLGGLVFGFSFVWSDLVCYTVGVAMGLCLEYALHCCNPQKLPKKLQP